MIFALFKFEAVIWLKSILKCTSWNHVVDKERPGLRRALASLTEYLRHYFIWFTLVLVGVEEELLH